MRRQWTFWRLCTFYLQSRLWLLNSNISACISKLKVYTSYYCYSESIIITFSLKYSLQLIKHFVAEATDEIQSIFRLQAAAMTEFSQMVTFFGEDPKTMSTNEVFGIFSDFIINFEASRAVFVNVSNCVFGPICSVYT